ncbi:CRTAC1 family protein [Actinosynnema sp. NPDC047251]|uniref:ASPIC/UnbV domain-containing protein n=1 Tax=Saccharothrix espanaensis (strain ATCC 51144 / DSM 44229 / JCM 9112 / NBRC 15066 / NRRL 15764) TaxID=1179773 RepID=K0K2W8_SACES|nr:CRTAC1 family protein [Saccharothrix espanaensis]CCH31214.1 ASPIC/UnbV domain-containing protein [Saccharothrix espanaensis DSM 44229]
MSTTAGWLRKQLPGIIALVLVAATFAVARLPTSSAAEKRDLAAHFGFAAESIALPGGYTQQSMRRVNQDYRHIDAWISSVGSAIALNDLDGDGLSNDLCFVDVRIDQVIVTPAPEAGEQPRYEPFALSAGPLPTNDVMAPMGCVPGDFNEDGRMDLLVYLWGRTPILHLAANGDQDRAEGLTAESYTPTELVPGASGGRYSGPEWNTNSATVADFDGDGHDDLYIGNYFPHGPVLDPSKSGGVEMNHSMSMAFNGGEDYLFRWTGGTSGPTPSASFERDDKAIPQDASKGWALASSSNDVDGDLLPELYLAHDFGPDRMLHNLSTPGRFEFALVEGVRGATEPKSKNVGKDSFKGMGVDFGDLNGDGVYDMFVSNITTSFGIEESHFAWLSTSGDTKAVKEELDRGVAPWEDESAPLHLAWSGWGWDVKLADFDNSGGLEVAQATGFVKGEVNRWPQLQELATANDSLLSNPLWWPHMTAGDDVSGSQRFHLFVKNPGEQRYTDLAPSLGLDVPVPTRGIATGDVDGDGKLDMAVSRQWADPVFYHNTGESDRGFLGLRLTHPGNGGKPGSPAIGAQVTVTTPDGHKQVNRVDGGSGHSGKRSHEVHFGLGDATGPVAVHVKWRDRDGTVHEQEQTLSAGWHDLQLGDQAEEK